MQHVEAYERLAGCGCRLYSEQPSSWNLAHALPNSVLNLAGSEEYFSTQYLNFMSRNKHISIGSMIVAEVGQRWMPAPVADACGS